ncbi:MAG: hypothetical protein ACI4V7_07435 [Succinivibrionaceae bacterium]
MQFNFYKCNGTWNMKTINETCDTETITCFDNTVTNEQIVDIALILGKGDNVEINVNFTERN